MTDDDLDERVKLIIRLVGNTLPPNCHIKAFEKNGETWFCFTIIAEWGGTIRGCLNPRQGVSALIRRLLEDNETVPARQAAFLQAESLLRQLLTDLPQDVADFILAMLNKASEVSIQKASSRLVRDLRVSGDPYELLSKVEKLADPKTPSRELSKWLFDMRREREKITTGRKGSKLTRSDVIEARKEYKQVLPLFREIRKDHTQEKNEYKKKPEIMRHGFKPTEWKKEWDNICARRVRYPELPKDILARFVDESPSEIAAHFVSKRFGISTSYFKTHILPKAKKLQK